MTIRLCQLLIVASVIILPDIHSFHLKSASFYGKSFSTSLRMTSTIPEVSKTSISSDELNGCRLDLNELDDDETAPLISHIEKLSQILGEVVKRENPNVYELYEKFCAHALARSNHNDKEALPKMVECGRKISSEDAFGTIRAFTQTLNLVNAAEVYHRMRLLRDADILAGHSTPLPMREDSVAGTIDLLINQDIPGDATDEKKKSIYDALLKQKVDIVLTAHPTEVNRRTLLRKYRHISETLAVLDRKDLSPYENAQAQEALRREIFSIWGSDEIRRNKPTPLIEAKGGLAIVETVLWDAVPSYLRKLNAQCVESLGQALPLDHVPIRFSSWMGGDRDGNPNVTPKVTLQVAITQRMQAARLILNDILTLYSELAICRGFSPQMLDLAKSVKKSHDKRELYRRVLGHLKKRLEATIKWCEEELLYCATHTADDKSIAMQSRSPWDAVSGTSAAMAVADNDEEDDISPIFDSEELLSILRTMHESLCFGGYADVADGSLIDLIRRVATFGVTLVPLDLRQESTRHKMALDAITQYLGLGSYADWDEDTKIQWIMQELKGKRPLFRTRDVDNHGFDPLVMDTLHTVRVAAMLGPGSLGAYVISQATSASDVLAVMLLQKQYGMKSDNNRMMRVVPLFETLNDLTNAASVVETLFSLPGYIESVKGQQEIMVGYSDSAKDAGRLAACWAQYESQEKMVKVAEKYGVDLTFFHGKGGTVGRGGNPALYRAVLAHPPKTINGKFRVTEQGEMITQNFGSTGIAERTLDIYTAAVLREKFVRHVDPKPHWRTRMDVISKVSCDAYRTVIEEKSFIRYFRTVTPELELGSLNIGSRPAKRNPAGGIESLRAIPWQFAWTQIRHHLPAWLGVGEGLDTSSDPATKEELREMYVAWPFFREMIDLIGMTLSKTDYSISTNYERQLVDDSDAELKEVGDELRRRLVTTRENVLRVTQCDDFSSGFQLLKLSMKVRNPYVDPLNVLQAEIMKRLRSPVSETATPEESASEMERRQILADGFIISVNGIAQGMKNS
eukprot:gene10309-21509_t